jgi:predicted oxidoreductase (fatty acid repression mutant protein)
MIDEDIRTEWNVPPSWKLRAHMNFGAILSPASEKAFMSDEKRFIVAKQP